MHSFVKRIEDMIYNDKPLIRYQVVQLKIMRYVCKQ